MQEVKSVKANRPKLRENKLTPAEYEQYLINQGANNYAQQIWLIFKRFFVNLPFLLEIL